MSGLGRLLDEDPVRFAEVAATVAAELEGLAAHPDDGLAHLAGRFRAGARARALPSLEDLGNGLAGRGTPDSRVQAYAGRGARSGAAGRPDLWARVARIVEGAAARGP
jgi:hypothetical protein